MSVPLRTRIWQEQPDPQDPYQADTARCHGYDVYGELLGHIDWPGMLLLMLRGEAAPAAHRALLSDLMVALANPGPRHPAVHAAMAGAVGGAPAGACLIAALSVGSGRALGAREVYEAVCAWTACAGDYTKLPAHLAEHLSHSIEIWPEHACWPGFGPHHRTTPRPVQQTLARLCCHVPGGALTYLDEHHQALSAHAGFGLNFCGLTAAACVDLGLSPAQAEMLHLLLSLPGAAIHALEQAGTSYTQFPYGDVVLLDDPDDTSCSTR